MNINEAKDQIKKAVSIYLKKDEYGIYRIPQERQRPVFLLGAPGIGKTAIIEQIAKELDIALVSYSMTHHTRQSALGLPIIKHKKYGDVEFDVSEYTMSEIIASIYETMEKTKKTEGILFLDEINCVSETLAPSMLLFLQYKMFGKHKVPEGWIVVTAGNPPQFNRSVREFDIVTMDRLKVLEVDADYETWRAYAVNNSFHTAVITYLDIKTKDFYSIENTVDGKSYVTARGWENLSETLFLYEEMLYKVDETLVAQYLRNQRIARDFSAYYDLFIKYKQDYKVSAILTGKPEREIIKMAKEAGFDERLSLMGLLLEAIQNNIHECVAKEDELKLLHKHLKHVKELFSGSLSMENCVELLEHEAMLLTNEMNEKDIANSLSTADEHSYIAVIRSIRDFANRIKLQRVVDSNAAFDLIKSIFDADVAKMRENNRQTSLKLSNLFDFVENVFKEESEMLILVTDLTINKDTARFISANGCDKYFKYNKKFQLYERGNKILEDIKNLEADELTFN